MTDPVKPLRKEPRQNRDPLPGAAWTHPLLELLPPDDWAHTFFAAYLGRDGLGSPKRALRHTRPKKFWKDYKARLDEDEAFRVIHADADQELKDAFEYVLVDRVLYGTDKPIFNRGDIVGYVNEVDNMLLRWTLERLDRKKWHLPSQAELDAAGPAAFKFEMGEKAAELEPGTDSSE